NLTFSGGGSVTLNTPNSVTTSTTLNGGTLTINNSLAVGVTATNLVLNAGTLLTNLTNGLELTNALFLPNSIISLGSNTNTNGLVFTGNPTLSGTNVTLNVNNTSSIFTGAFAGAINLIKNGTGALYLTGGNAFTLFTINGGIVNAQNATALGVAAATTA